MGREVVGATLELAGQVQTEAGDGISGVRLTIDPPVAAQALTDAEGRYAFARLQEGTYTIRPGKHGCRFEPAETTVTIAGDVSGRDFVGEGGMAPPEQMKIRAKVPWEQWYNFYGDVLDPLMSVGAEINVYVRLTAEAEGGMGSDLVERLHNNLTRFDEDAQVDT